MKNILLCALLLICAVSTINAQILSDLRESCSSVPCVISPQDPGIFFGNNPIAILSQITLSGLPVMTAPAKIEVQTWIRHTYSSDVTVTLTSPQGTQVAIVQSIGDASVDVFDGTVWNDYNLFPGYVYAVDGVVSPLAPIQPLSAFIGEDPNGNWTLSVVDAFPPYDMGYIRGWGINIDYDNQCPGDCVTNCFDLVNSYSCTCQSYWAHGNCPSVACESNPCLNNGVCADGGSVSEFNCTCPPEAYGDQCENRYDDCSIAGCENNGACVPVDGTSYALCDCSNTGYEGWFCENKTDFCATNHCQNGAECVSGELTYTCNCVSPYVGTNCDTQANAVCTSFPCITDELNIPIYNHDIYFYDTGSYTVTSYILVDSPGLNISSITITTGIQHTWCQDLYVQLVSPKGTTIEITRNYGAAAVNMFYGTWWEDGVSNPTSTSRIRGTVSPLGPDEPLSTFKYEDPNGVWTLIVTDESTSEDDGTLHFWGMYIEPVDTGDSNGTGESNVTQTDLAVILSVTIVGAIILAGVIFFMYRYLKKPEDEHTKEQKVELVA